MEKKDKKELVKIVAGCVAAVISISCIVAYKIHSDKENAKYEEKLKAERLYRTAERGFKTMLGYGKDDTGLVITNTDFGNHDCLAYGYGLYTDTVYVTGVKDTEIILVQYFRVDTGSDCYAVSNVDCNEESNCVKIQRTHGDSNVYFDSSDDSIESVNSFAVYDTVTKELYIPKNN